jgi:hypothetical protein
MAADVAAPAAEIAGVAEEASVQEAARPASAARVPEPEAAETTVPEAVAPEAGVEAATVLAAVAEDVIALDSEPAVENGAAEPEVAEPEAIEPETAEPEAGEPEVPPAAERGLATILGGPIEGGRPTWLDVPPARVGPLLAVFADEGARLLAMTVLPPAAPDAEAPPAEVALRYHFVVNETPITMSTQTPPRAAPSAAGLFPAMTWRERELAGEYGLRFVEPPMEVPGPEAPAGDQPAGPADPAADALIPYSQPPTPDS